jgi:predicted nucleotidyltransferase
MSGYVAILLGRTRATDDIDVFIDEIDTEKFAKLHSELTDQRFWCLNAESNDEIFSYLEEGYAIRFATMKTSVPNFEIKYPKDDLDRETFNDAIKVVINSQKIKISGIERQIAFKRYHLGSPKDSEDASHLETLFPHVNTEKINKYKTLIEARQKKELE